MVDVFPLGLYALSYTALLACLLVYMQIYKGTKVLPVALPQNVPSEFLSDRAALVLD